MTDQHDPDLRALDDAARAASRGLHRHIARSVDTEIALVTLPAAPVARGRGRLLAVAAAAALLVGSVVTLSDQQGDGGDRSRLELDEDGNKLPTPQPGVLTPLGPRDGKDSIQLPVAITPVEGLRDGDVVTASSPGFQPGEQVGIVQCAREAGGDTPEQRGGVDGCNIGTVEYAEADSSGLATGLFTVRRTVTTPLTGTVDCAAEADRCIVAMGAINDYDRSGGMGFTIAGGGEPIEVPTLSVSPAEGLQDADVVRVEGEGYAPRSIVNLSICSKDPATCWTTGAEIQIEGDGAEGAQWFNYDEDGSGGTFIGLQADDQGRLGGDVPVWRFLPGEAPGTYVDCALSECSLRVSTDTGTAPPPARLGFAPGGEGPIPPAVAVDPANNLAPGDTVVVRGAGFAPDLNFYVSLCVSPADRPEELFNCFGGGNGEDRTDGAGTFAVEFDIPDPRDMEDYGYIEEMATTTTACADCVVVPSPVPPGTPAFSCDGGVTICSIRVEAHSEDQIFQLRPSFPPAPVIITFRPGA